MKLTEQEKTERREARKAARLAAKETARIEAERNQKPVDCIRINVIWSKAGHPVAEACAIFQDGTSEQYTSHKAGGWGYDKESSVIADVFNHFLLYKLWALSEDDIKGGHGSGDDGPAPYGIQNSAFNRHFAGGIGINCYYSIARHIGGEFSNTYNGRSENGYIYNDKSKRG